MSVFRALLGSSLALAAGSAVFLVSSPRPSRAFLAALGVHVLAGVFLLALGSCALFPRRALPPRGRGLPGRRGRTRPFRPTRPPAVAAGTGLWLVSSTGLVLVAGGRSCYGGLILALHLGSAAALAAIVSLALVRGLRKAGSRAWLRRAVGATLVATALGFAGYENGRSAGNVESYSYPFGENPFYPSNVRTPGGRFLRTSQFPPAAQCARCHPGVHRQWSESAHRNSFREPFYRKNVELLIAERGIEVTRHCEGCHNPIALVSGALSRDSTVARPFDEEGVTCAVCHSITNISLEGTGSYEIRPPAMLFEEDGTWAKSAANAFLLWLVTAVDPDLHRHEMTKPFLRTPEFCAVCHKSALPREIDDYKWRRPFSAYDEWQMSAHSNESLLPFYRKPRNTCQGCHMPRERVAWDAASDRGTVVSHRWAAANTAIPFFYGFREQLETVEAFLRSGVVKVDLFALWKGEARPSQREATDFVTLRNGTAGGRIAEGFTTIDALNASLPFTDEEGPPWIAPLDKSQFSLGPGETVTLGVIVSNPGVGHLFPTELRDFYEPWLEFRVEDATGRSLFASGFLEENGQLDPRAHVFQAIQVTERSEWIRRHEVWETRGKAYDNFVAPGRSQLVRYQFTIPEDAVGPLRVSARVLYRRFNRFYSDWVLGTSVDYPIVEMASASVRLELGPNVPEDRTLTPTDARRFNDFGIALLDQFLFGWARRAFERATEVDPDYADGYVNAAMTFFRRNEFARMRGLLARALELDPENPRALYYLGAAARIERRFGEAIAILEGLRRRFPKDRLLLNQLGAAYAGAGRNAEARRVFERVLEIDPDDVTALWHLAQVYRELGEAPLGEATKARYLDRFEDWRSHYFAAGYLVRDDLARAEAIPWHVHADVDLPTPASAGGSYWISDGLGRLAEAEPPESRSDSKPSAEAPGPESDAVAAPVPGFEFSTGYSLRWGEGFENFIRAISPPKDTWWHYCGPDSRTRSLKVCFVEKPLLPEPYSIATLHFNADRFYEAFLEFPQREFESVRRSWEKRLASPGVGGRETVRPRIGEDPVEVSVVRWERGPLRVELRSRGRTPGTGRVAVTFLPLSPPGEAPSPL